MEQKPMAEPLRSGEPLSSMRFSESPSQPAALLPEHATDKPLGEWPVTDSRDTRLQNAGEAVGTALGTVVNEAREIPGRLQDRMADIKKRFKVITGRRVAEVKSQASEVADDVEKRALELSAETKRELQHWEFRARLYAREYPLELIAATAGAGFVIGILLGLWREE
jgi:ElaB/YqjD/DUF883 family membrane-anchored ribosome-binding protein